MGEDCGKNEDGKKKMTGQIEIEKPRIVWGLHQK